MVTQSANQLPVTALSGVGEILKARLAKMGIETLQDLLFHFPQRYEDRSHIYPINTLKPGIYATINGKILYCDVIIKKRRMLICTVSDHTGIVTLRFMHFNQGMKNSLAVGEMIQAYGEIKRGNHSYEMIHPQYKLGESLNLHAQQTTTLTPIYPLTEGIKQQTIHKLIQQAFILFQQHPNSAYSLLDPLLTPSIPFISALYLLHNPPLSTDLMQLQQRKHPAQQRLIIEELIAYHLSMLFLRANTQKSVATPLTGGTLPQQFKQSLPFALTSAQSAVFDEIRADMAKPVPMMRLVQGDVGCGKTIVAALAALLSIENKQQVALMVPTELLAEQHYLNFKRWFTPLGITVGLLAGKQKSNIRTQHLTNLADGTMQMVIGTHALFQNDINFYQLSLVIIDEQHRFGVNQRLALWQKGKQQHYFPHQLAMTATPIPRTLTMTIYADLDVSIIDQLPPGRTTIKTAVVSNVRRQDIISRIRQSCLNGRQAYWVCTLIEESDVLEAQAAIATTEELQQQLPELKISLIHGRMKNNEKQSIMAQFVNGELDLLVATTVIEVGVDVPNASLMIIENPERLGLAQLHQLRGRVGRGKTESYCVLLYKLPLSQTAKKRLHVMRSSNDGFFIAQQDLEIRGPGEILGTQQTGLIRFKIADLITDQLLIPKAQQIAQQIFQQNQHIAKQLVNNWLSGKVQYIHA